MRLTVSQCMSLSQSDALKEKFKNQEKLIEVFSSAVGAICKTVAKSGSAVCKTISGNR